MPPDSEPNRLHAVHDRAMNVADTMRDLTRSSALLLLSSTIR